MPLFGFLLLFVGVFLYVGIKMNNVISLANLSVLIGGFLVALSVYSLAKPAAVGQALRGFPRANAPGYVLMLAATLWFLWNIKIEDMADYREIKHWFYLGFGAVGIGSCFFLRDFLAACLAPAGCKCIRGLGLLFRVTFTLSPICVQICVQIYIYIYTHNCLFYTYFGNP